MKYRRNVDEELRNLERILQAEQSPEALARYNAARVRAGQPPLVPLRLEWGYNLGLPEVTSIGGENYTTATTAWGARAILEDQGVSLLWDRQSIVAPNEESRQTLIITLNGSPRGTGAIAAANEEAARLLRRGLIDSAREREVILYDDSLLRIVANTNASQGYLYMVGFIKLPGMLLTEVDTTKQCDQCKEELDPGEELVECRYCHQLICPRCRVRCPACQQFTCEDHEPIKCKHCQEVICGSDECNRRGGPSFSAKECPNCGEMYCRDCRAEVKNCPCGDDLCKECGDEIEECKECGEPRCSCSPCSCDNEEEFESEEFESEDADESAEEERRNPNGDEIEEALDDYNDDEDLELGGWAIVHDSGDLIADGFSSQTEAEEWLVEAVREGFLDGAPETYHITQTED